jgi:hypothetical protein
LPGQIVGIPIRRCDVAEYLGLQPETVSRGFRELRTRKIVKFRSSSIIEITRLPDLKRIVNGGQASDGFDRSAEARVKMPSLQ